MLAGWLKVAPHAAMVATITAWGAAFGFIKIALESVTALDLTLMRFLVAAVPFLVLLPFVGVPKFAKTERWPVVAVAVLSVAGFHVALNYGETAISAGVGSLIVGTSPVWAAIFAAVILKERVTRRQVLGIALALAGVVALIRAQGGAFSVAYYVPAAVALIAPASWALSAVLSKPLLARHGPMPFTTVTTLLGTAFLLPVALTGTVGRVASAPPNAWSAFLVLGIASTFFGYLGFNYALRAIGPTAAVAYIYLVPVAAFAWSRVLTGEALTWPVALSGAAVIAGVVITNWRPKPKPANEVNRHVEPQDPA